MDYFSIPYFGEALSLVTAVVWATAIILFKKSGESVHPIGLNLSKDFLAMVLFFPTIWLMGEEVLRDAPLRDYAILLASGAIGIGVADTLLFMALNRLGAGRFAIVDCLYAPFVIGMAVLALGETLSFYQIIGAILTVSAAFLAAYHKESSSISGRDLIVGVLLGASSLAMTGIGVVMVKPILNNSPVLWVTEIRLIGGVAVLFIVLAFHRKRRAIVNSIFSVQHRTVTFLGSLIGGYVVLMLWLGGMKYTFASIAAILNQSTSIFVFIFAALFLRERIDVPKTIGIVLGVAGALLVTFGRELPFVFAP